MVTSACKYLACFVLFLLAEIVECWPTASIPSVREMSETTMAADMWEGAGMSWQSTENLAFLNVFFLHFNDENKP